MDLPLDQQNIINILGIQALPDDRKVALLDKIVTLVEKRLLLRIMDSLSSQNQEALKQVLDGEDEESVNNFLTQHAPQMGEWMEEETLKVKSELADAVKME